MNAGNFQEVAVFASPARKRGYRGLPQVERDLRARLSWPQVERIDPHAQFGSYWSRAALGAEKTARRGEGAASPGVGAENRNAVPAAR